MYNLGEIAISLQFLEMQKGPFTPQQITRSKYYRLSSDGIIIVEDIDNADPKRVTGYI